MARALRRARADVGPAFASVSVPVAAATDVSATVLAARRHEDGFFCFEQPDRARFALAGLGEAARIEASGEGRAGELARRARLLGGRVVADEPAADPAAPAAAGPVWVGGFAFAGDGGSAPEWGGLKPAQLALPEISLARRGEEARLTVCAPVDPDDTPDGVLERVRERLAEMAPTAMPLIDPDPVERARVASAAPPSHYEEAVRRAVERIRDGELEKVVLAREVRVHAPRPMDPAPVFGALREIFPACFNYLVGTPEAAFVGASPELLVRREGARAQTVALAGTARRSADPAVDDHLGEQLLRSGKDRREHEIVAHRIERTLDPVSLWTATADEPGLIGVHNVQHLATPIRRPAARAARRRRAGGIAAPDPGRRR